MNEKAIMIKPEQSQMSKDICTILVTKTYFLKDKPSGLFQTRREPVLAEVENNVNDE